MNRLLSVCVGVTISLCAAASCAAASANAELRTAKVAGQFYPEDRQELQDLITELLERQPDPIIAQKPRILIVPHAGYQYSGLVAANAYRHLNGQPYDGVVVVGFTHRLQFDGSSVDASEAYLTPLGDLPIDREAAAVLQSYPGIGHVEEAHEAGEHSMEVQLPFLQVALERTRVVPVLMGQARLEDASRLADALAGLSRLGDYLFIFSTDLSHYHPYSEAESLDELTVGAILSETPQAVSRLFDAGEIEACGRGPIVASLLLAAKLGYLKRELLYYANSGDTFGTPASVVGYAAIGMFERSSKPSGLLSEASGQALVKASREALERAIGKRDLPAATRLESYPELSRTTGAFVTLTKRGQLRGCVGRIETNEPLSKTVPMVAVEAALKDGRFPPVTAQELGELHVEVSVLTKPVKLKSLEELVPGRDGVVLEHQGRSGVFLPQVWTDTGWTRVEFLRQLASQKAGLPPDAWQQTALYVFQDQIFEEPRH